MDSIDKVISKLKLLGEQGEILKLSEKSCIIEEEGKVRITPSIYSNCTLEIYNIIAYNIEEGIIQRKDYQRLIYNIEDGVAVGFKDDRIVILDEDLVKITDMAIDNSLYAIRGITEDYILIQKNSNKRELVEIYNYRKGETIKRKRCGYSSILYFGNKIIVEENINNEEHTIFTIYDDNNSQTLKVAKEAHASIYGKFKWKKDEIEGLLFHDFTNTTNNFYVITDKLERIDIDSTEFFWNYATNTNFRLITTRKIKERYDLINTYITERISRLENIGVEPRRKWFYGLGKLYYKS